MTNIQKNPQQNNLTSLSVEIQANIRRAELELPKEKFTQLLEDLEYIPSEKLNQYIEKFVVLQEGLIPITIFCNGIVKNFYK